MRYENVWQFKTPNFTVAFDVAPEDDLDLSWDDEGDAREGLESGRYVAFVARVRVLFKGATVGVDYLGGCIYRSADEFRHQRGYFGDMVREACHEARKHLREVPRLRSV